MSWSLPFEEEHECCHEEQVKLLGRMLEKLTEKDSWPIGKSVWVNDMALVGGQPHWWNGNKWVRF